MRERSRIAEFDRIIDDLSNGESGRVGGIENRVVSSHCIIGLDNMTSRRGIRSWNV